MELYIIDDWDRPHEITIARKSKKNGKFYYIHHSLRNVKQHHGMTPDRPTKLEAFGIDWTISNGILTGNLVNTSTATYRDGRPRKWQGLESFTFSLGAKYEYLTCSAPATV